MVVPCRCNRAQFAAANEGLITTSSHDVGNPHNVDRLRALGLVNLKLYEVWMGFERVGLDFSVISICCDFESECHRSREIGIFEA